MAFNGTPERNWYYRGTILRGIESAPLSEDEDEIQRPVVVIMQ